MKPLKRKKQKKLAKLKKSLLSPLDKKLCPPYLVKQRVLLKNQISLPEFKVPNLDWLKVYKTSKILKRSLVASPNDKFPTSPSQIYRKQKLNPDSKFVQTSSQLKESSEYELFPSTHSHTSTISGLVIDMKSATLNPASSKIKASLPKVQLSTRIYQKPSPKYIRKDFDSSIIPQKPSNPISFHELTKYYEYSARTPFK